LFNALPAPHPDWADPSFVGPIRTSVDVNAILFALAEGTQRLAALTLPDDAPPAFLVDARRHSRAQLLAVGVFDNRSVVFRTDFPSAAILRDHGVTAVLLICESARRIAWDLVHVLSRWQKEGIALMRRNLDDDRPPAPWTVRGPGWFGYLWSRLSTIFGLHPAPSGGFGDFIHAASG
jgi:hypothetical protein